MFISVIRFMLNGWVDQLYVQPKFFFSYYGFEWVKPLGETGMHVVFVLMAVAALLVALGLFYRVSALSFFMLFTYVELLDKTNYLNHYYFVSIVAFLMIWLPAHQYFSLDVLRRPSIRRTHVPRWYVGAIRVQLGMVYFFAGVAKLNYDWLVRAMPLKIWLPAKAHLPVIGGLLKAKWAAFLFSWVGCLYDLTVPFLLTWKRTRILAYMAVIGFHLMTFFLFQIGMFPFIMILCTLVFFPAEGHRKVVEWVSGRFSPLVGAGRRLAQRAVDQRGVNQVQGVYRTQGEPVHNAQVEPPARPYGRVGVHIRKKLLFTFLALHFFIQVLLPFRYLLYPKDLFWHEQGFRFSWRVMLIEKAGYATFHIKDPATGRSGEIQNCDYLTANQEKMMATQPDMILQFAHFLEKEYQKQGIEDPEIYAEVYVTLNGSGSRPFIDPEVDLTKEKEGFHRKTWILPFEQKVGWTSMKK